MYENKRSNNNSCEVKRWTKINDFKVFYNVICQNIVWFWQLGYSRSNLNPIQDEPFRGCSRMGDIKRPPSLNSLTHILQSWNLAHFTLSKEDPRNIWITWHISWVLMTSAFFHQKLANFATSENTDIDCILVHNFQFF